MRRLVIFGIALGAAGGAAYAGVPAVARAIERATDREQAEAKARTALRDAGMPDYQVEGVLLRVEQVMRHAPEGTTYVDVVNQIIQMWNTMQRDLMRAQRSR